MSCNVVALPGFTAPSLEPVSRVVEILQEALNAAKAGKAIGVALVLVERDPLAFTTQFHAEHSSRHTLGSGVLSISHQVGEEMTKP